MSETVTTARGRTPGEPANEAVYDWADATVRARYLYDAEFHAAVHVYAIKTRGDTSWVDGDGVRHEGPPLADARAVADMEAAGLGWANRSDDSGSAVRP